MKRYLALIPLAAVAAGVVAFAAAGAEQQRGTTLTVYSGRDERFVKPMFDRFTQLTGIEVNVRYGDSAALVATLLEEGANSPADVFYRVRLGDGTTLVSQRPSTEVVPLGARVSVQPHRGRVRVFV